MNDRWRYLLERLIQAAVCVWGVSVIIFCITHFIGDPVQLLMPAEASQADRLAYPIRDDVPVMLVDEARALSADEIL
jgi:ABC-type dipeptide/oligopeptide/nickel transport system permease component